MRATVGVLLVMVLCGGLPARAAEPKLETEEQKTLYVLGQVVSRSLESYSLTAEEAEIVKAGFTDALLKKKPRVEIKPYRGKLQKLAQSRMKAAAEGEKKASEEFLATAAAQKGAVKTASGLVYTEMTPGTGASPKATDTVKVHYHGTLRDGTVFDSSVQRKTPATFPLNRVIPCWTEGVQRMKVGGKSKLVCPSGIAYGDRGAPPRIKPGAALSFEVELLEIVKTPAAGAPAPAKK